MCGIVGFAGKRTRISELVESLRKLEYRGYDSAGIACVVSHPPLFVVKTSGKIERLSRMVSDEADRPITAAIGHTRWATHGEPSDKNSHPHLDCSKEIAIVHNGIIENYCELRESLLKKSHRFESSTDSEVIAHLVEEFYSGDLQKAVKRASEELRGAYAIAVIHSSHPGLIVTVRRGSPLVVAHYGKAGIVASDVTPILRYTREVFFLEDGSVASIDGEGISIIDAMGNPVKPNPSLINWDEQSAEKSGFEHFMLKEIFEQPQSLRSTLAGRIRNSRVDLEELHVLEDRIESARKVKIVACGTSYHAGLVFRRLLEEIALIDTEIDVASELRYRNRKHASNNDSVIVAISQSGETADTLEFLRQNRKECSAAIAVTNSVGSSITREVDATLLLNSGPEIGVAATKTYSSQLSLLCLLAIKIAEIRCLSTKDPYDLSEMVGALVGLPGLMEGIIESSNEQTRSIADQFNGSKNFLFIGRGYGYPTALEGALKLKEISYINAFAVQAGELKHGHIALLDREFPVLAIAPSDSLRSKTLSNITEVKARGAPVILITNEDGDRSSGDWTMRVPTVVEPLFPILMAPHLQLFAYHMAVLKGLDPDKPRNLAKSVTVE